MKPVTLVLLSFLWVFPAAVHAAESGTLFRGKQATLYYEILGSGGGTPLVLVNGGPGAPHDYLHCSDAWDILARGRRVLLYDQRGVGRSPRLAASQSCSLADQIADLDALLDHLHMSRADLLGHSWGGYLVMAYAARHPARVSKLIICDSGAPKLQDTRFLFKEIFPETMARMDAFSFAEELGDTAASNASFREYLSMLCYSPQKREVLLTKPAVPTLQSVNRALWNDAGRFDLTPELAKFRFPALVLTGRYDINVAPSVAWGIHHEIPNSRFVVFETSGHLPFYEERDHFVDVVESFLAHP
jgi:proline iminopeptidase